MNIALFAGKEVGYKVARKFGERPSLLSYLVVDSTDESGKNGEIIATSSIAQDKVLGSEGLYSQETLERLRNSNLDLGILAWWPHIIKEPLLSIPKSGFLNFHPSLLPFQRGKHPNFWAIREGTPYGVTLHFIDAGVDSGPIAYQREIPVTFEDTGETLYRKALDEIVNLFSENFEDIINGNIPRIPQPKDRGTFHRAKEIDEASRIDLDQTYTGRELIDIMRARTFPPHPGARFTYQGQEYELGVSIKRTRKS